MGMVVRTAFVFWHATIVTKPQMPVIPPNPRLAKLSIAAVEPIDDVDRQGCRFGPDLRLADSWGWKGRKGHSADLTP